MARAPCMCSWSATFPYEETESDYVRAAANGRRHATTRFGACLRRLGGRCITESPTQSVRRLGAAPPPGGVCILYGIVCVSPPPQPLIRTIVYVDGFNLYYG
jgi:hypothetical protein